MRGEIGPEIEGGVPHSDERFDGGRQRRQRPGLREVCELGVVGRIRRPIHDGVHPHDGGGGDHHEQHRVLRVALPHDDKDDRQRQDSERGTQLECGDPVVMEEWSHRPRRAVNGRVGDPSCHGTAAGVVLNGDDGNVGQEQEHNDPSRRPGCGGRG